MSEFQLVVVEGENVGRAIPVAGVVVFGRDTGANVVLTDTEVSSRHASFEPAEGGLTVKDLGSTNGTFVNGHRLTDQHRLRADDKVRLGRTVLELRIALDATKVRPVVELTVVKGNDPGRSIPIAGPTVVGRLSGADVVIQDDEISGRHASFEPANGGLTVEDLASRNGTSVNGERISATRPLTVGDKVAIGNTVLEVRARVEPTILGAVPETAERRRAPAARENSIVVEGLVREFKKGPRAVDGIDLYVEPGEIFGFLGPNGAGKSTTVHMLTTLLPPSGGTARVNGYDVAKEGARVRGSIGVALQEAALDPLLNAHEHMALQSALQGVPKAQRQEKARSLLERVGLTEAADRRVGRYSGGMKRRLDLALALVHDPPVLFLDEPTTGLDPKSRSDLWEEVGRLAKVEGVTVFLTTQYLEEADLLADRIAIIDGGKIVAQGTPAELKAEIGQPTVEAIPRDDGDRPALKRVLERFGEPAPGAHKGEAVRLRRGTDDLADIVRALDAEGLRVEHLDLHAPTLDDVFLAKTGRSLEAEVEEVERERRSEVRPLSLPGQPIVSPGSIASSQPWQDASQR